jgi:hypothetical protein
MTTYLICEHAERIYVALERYWELPIGSPYGALLGAHNLGTQCGVHQLRCHPASVIDAMEAPVRRLRDRRNANVGEERGARGADEYSGLRVPVNIERLKTRRRRTPLTSPCVIGGF